MNQDELFKHFEKAVKDVLNNPKVEVSPEATLFDDLGLESIDLLDLSCDLEKTLGRELDFKAIYKHVTTQKGVTPNQVRVRDVVGFIAASP